MDWFLSLIAKMGRSVDLFFGGTESNLVSQPKLWVIPFVLLTFFLIFGPCPRITDAHVPLGWKLYAITLIVLVFIASIVQYKAPSNLALLWGQLCVVLVLFIVSCIFIVKGHLSPDNPSYVEGDAQWFYFPHVGSWLALIVFLISIIGWWTSRWWLLGISEDFHGANIHLNELLFSLDISPKQSYKITERLAWASTAPIRYLFEVLTATSLIVLLVLGPLAALLQSSFVSRINAFGVRERLVELFQHNWIVWLCVGGLFLLIWLIAAAGQCDERIEELCRTFRRTFSYGGMGAVSLVAIIVVVCWLLKVSYIRTVVEGDRTVVCWYLLACYSLFWCHEYWMHRSLNTWTIPMFEAKATVSAQSVDGDASKDANQPQHTSHRASAVKIEPPVPQEQDDIILKALKVDASEMEKRELEVRIHGASQIGIYENGEFKKAYEPTDLIDSLIEKMDVVAIRSQQDPKELIQKARDLARRFAGLRMAHFASINGVVFGLLIGFFVWIFRFERIPNLQVDRLGNGTFKLRENLFGDFKPSAPKPKEPLAESVPRPRVILVAASGGGSRAACFVQSGLAGLHRVGVLKDVKLVSGVSGGGAAVGYFASHHSALIQESYSSVAGTKWQQFASAMGHDYIIDVLRGAPEYRISHQSFIGTLLAESLERQFNNSDFQPRFEDLPIGVIFNTTLVGESPAHYRPASLSPAEIAKPNFASGARAGSRVILTNLNVRRDSGSNSEPQDPFPFPDKGPEWARHDYLHYHVLADKDISVSKAIALNANFPPVFPNAPIDIGDTKQGEFERTSRLWVTDGGALENKGEISLVYALEAAIEEQLKSVNTSLVDPNSAAQSPLPDIHVVVFEASAGSLGYTHDQGISAALSGATRLANQLAWEVEKRVQDKYQELVKLSGQASKDAPKLMIHWIPMPSTLRIDSGIGTHWMFPETVALTGTGENGVETVVLSKAATRDLIDDLHREAQGRITNPSNVSNFKHSNESDGLKKVWDWIDRDAYLGEEHSHTAQWESFLRQLRL